MTEATTTRWRGWTATAIVIHFAVILALGLFRHWGYMTSIFDLGVFDQAVWGTLHGDFMLNTSIFNQAINWLGFHFHPVLLLFVPLYAIAPYPEWFALAQALALSIAAWPIFLLASRVCKSEAAGLLWTLAYLVNPFLLNAAAWDFHPVALAVPFIALGLLAIEKADSRLLFLSCLPLLFIQEQLGLTVAAFGVLWWLRNRGWKTAVCLVLLGTAHTALVLGLIMPALSPTGQHLMLSNGLGQLSRYGWLGHSIGEVAQTLLTHPLAVIETLVFDNDGATYFGLLLLPFLGFPLAAGAFLLPGVPDLLANLLSANPMPRSIFAYHSVTLVPVFTVAGIYGSKRFALWFARYSLSQLAGLVVVLNFAMSYIFTPLPLPAARHILRSADLMNWHDPNIQAIRIVVGNHASAAVQANLGTHFSNRRKIYLHSNSASKTDAIILRLESPTSKLFPQELGIVATSSGHSKMRPVEYLASIECLLSNKDYRVALWRDPWLVLARSGNNSAAVNEVRNKLGRLQIEWQVDSDEYHASVAGCPK